MTAAVSRSASAAAAASSTDAGLDATIPGVVGPPALLADAEVVRSRHLEALGLADTPADPRFDRLTALARRLLDAPIASVTLIADSTAWFPSIAGLDLQSMSRCDTFCDVTVTRAATLVVPDALADPAYAVLPAVVGDAHVRAYAGVPLVDGSGVAVGAFCVYDTAPRAWTGTELETLRELAAWAQEELVASADMVRARSVQQALLPRQTVTVPGADVAGVCIPSQAVGGDFYDWDTPHGDFVFSLVDVMGKGTAAALVAATVRALLRARGTELARQIGQREVVTPTGGVRGGIGGVVRDVDRLLRRDLERTGSLVTGFVAQYEPTTGTLHYADAGHGLSVVVREDGSTQWLTSDDLPIGVDPRATWTEQTVTLLPGDTVLCCSDGLFDLLGGTFDALRRIESLVRACPDPADVVEQVARLCRRSVPVDDVTVVAVRRRPS